MPVMLSSLNAILSQKAYLAGESERASACGIGIQDMCARMCVLAG